MEYKLEPKRKSEVQFNGRVESDANWAVPFVSNVKQEFDQRFNELKEQYEQLMDEVHWNNIVYGVNIKFKPVIGKTYYLYKNDNDFTLSMIAPWEWSKEHLGTFRFDHTGKWVKL